MYQQFSCDMFKIEPKRESSQLDAYHIDQEENANVLRKTPYEHPDIAKFLLGKQQFSR